MPDAREVYDMVTKQKPPQPGALERQQKRQVRAARNKRIGAFTTAAAIGLVAIVLLLALRPGQNTTAPATVPPPVSATDQAAVAVATDFVKAYGAHQANRAVGDLGPVPVLDLLMPVSAPDEFRLLLSWLDATGYKQYLDGCAVTGSSASGTEVHCTFDYQNLRSDEIGLGPYSGSSIDLTVQNGKVVQASMYCEIQRFSPQMWEPFASWVSTTYPKDATVMYTDASLTDFSLTPPSVWLWEQHTKEYVKVVRQGGN
jgi:hypothetical protein